MKFPEVRRKILCACDIPNLFAFYHDKMWQEQAAEELSDRYAELLALFINDVDGFRQMMRKRDCIISGSGALWVLLGNPGDWKPLELDVMTREDNFFQVVDEIRRMVDATSLSLDRVASPLQAFKSRAEIGTANGTVHVLRSRYDCALSPIPFYSSTHLMNALTGDALYCAYPSLTLSGRGVRPVHWDGSREGSASKALGFNVHQYGRDLRDGSRGCTGFVACSKRQRFFGDRGTWIVPMGKGTVEDMVAPLRIMGTGAWRLGGPGCGNRQWTAFAAGMLDFEGEELSTDEDI